MVTSISLVLFKKRREKKKDEVENTRITLCLYSCYGYT